MKLRLCTSLACACVLVSAHPALAADCDVNVFNAYLTAMARGWHFRCDSSRVFPGFTPDFATYPPTTIGCSTKTGPVVPPDNIVRAILFSKESGLKNGWSLKSFEVMGDQWYAGSKGGDTLVAFSHGASAPNTSYNVKIKRMTLTKSGGVCANAINEAF